MPKAIIFDINGTLIDTVDLHAAWVQAFRDFGFTVAFADARAQIGKGGDQLMLVFLPSDVLERRGEELEQYRSNLFKKAYLPRARAFLRVRELFEHIRAQGQTTALASSGKKDGVERYQEIAGIADLVDLATASEDAERSKPDPDIFQAAVARLAPPTVNDAIVVGDTPYNAEAARKAGLQAVGVLRGGFPEQALRDAGCIAIYRDPEDLLRHYDNTPLRADAH
jgi:HAD superfamily hydrolase (TIGR01509 family)